MTMDGPGGPGGYPGPGGLGGGPAGPTRRPPGTMAGPRRPQGRRDNSKNGQARGPGSAAYNSKSGQGDNSKTSYNYGRKRKDSSTNKNSYNHDSYNKNIRADRPVPHVQPLPRDEGPRGETTARSSKNGGAAPIRARRLLARGNPARRLGITLLCIVFILSLFAGRLVQLQGMESGYYRQMVSSKHGKTVPLPAMRGSITAADGSVLAMTVQTYTVYADPTLMPASQRQSVANRLASQLSTTPAAILTLVQHPTSPKYVVLAKGVSAAAGNAITQLNLPGVGVTHDHDIRDYPDGGIAANIVGFTSTAGGNLAGEAGVEKADNALLAGRPGSERVQITSDGEPIPLGGASQPAVNGSGIKLTIYPALQYEAQQACKQEMANAKADNCSVVVMQPGTGRILAMAQWPTFDPSNINDIQQTTDIPLQNIFDPGSTAKVITAAAAFEHGGQTPMSAYYIPHSLVEGGTVIHDAEWSPGERFTVAGIIAHSSNIGMSQVVKHVPPQTQYDYLRNFGLGQPTGLNLAEEPGLLPVPSKWSGDTRYTLSFGQGVSVNAVQMASVYATIANGGVRVQPTLVEGTTSASGTYTPARPSPSRRVISAQTAHELIQILQQVPGFNAAGGEPWGIMPGYAIASKTGTSQEWDSSCPAAKPLCKYGSSYIGMAPGDNPQLIVAVNVQNPRKGGYYGAIVAGPVFYNVMRFALQTLKIPPDGAVPAKVRLTSK
jgi:cell division protein FtsI (penicillin-binding protein 3)